MIGSGIPPLPRRTAPAPQPLQLDYDKLWLPREVAALFKVDPKTVTRWVADGKLRSIPTPGGHHRIPGSEVQRMLNRPDTGE